MKVILPLIIVIILILAGGIYLASKNSDNSNMHMMGNGQMMNDNSMLGMNMGNDKQPVAQSHHSYALKLTSQTTNLQPNQQATITYKIVDEQGNVLKDFALDHTKLMHFIIVRKDLQDFQHIHPDFNKDTGEFTIPVTFPDSGTYRLFADFTPANGQKDAEGDILSVTPYKDVNVGNIDNYTPEAVTPDTETTKTVGDFQVDYTLPQPIQSNKSVTITEHVSKGGQPVTDMQEYLGALAHGILLKQSTLDFAHLHDMGMGQMDNMQGMNMGNMKITNTGPDISFTYTFPTSGIYKLFTQFQEGENVITTDYVIEVK